MKKLTLKEQLIALSLKGYTYRSCWYYVQYVLHELPTTQLDLQTCHQVMLHLAHQNIIPLEAMNVFLELSAEDFERIETLAQMAIAIDEATYPALWHEIPKPPLVVYYRGDLSLLQKSLVSLVGTRQVTLYGRTITEQMTQAIVNQGWVAVSGLATGIDQIVHETACAHQSNSTIAIIPTGFNHAYPPQNHALQQQLSQQHLVLSEYLPEVNARKHHFIMRNRLVAGISSATLVMEAARQSGSLITANFALQYNRELYAVPGRITDKTSQGCNEIIASGAMPILSVEETLQGLKRLFSIHQILGN
ncbi:MAG: DNA-processing protein DprA [Aerococcaceae bacterium]|nr:DNA-processing protein DprA [Aerococcaceae bacterium]